MARRPTADGRLCLPSRPPARSPAATNILRARGGLPRASVAQAPPAALPRTLPRRGRCAARCASLPRRCSAATLTCRRRSRIPQWPARTARTAPSACLLPPWPRWGRSRPRAWRRAAGEGGSVPARRCGSEERWPGADPNRRRRQRVCPPLRPPPTKSPRDRPPARRAFRRAGRPMRGPSRRTRRRQQARRPARSSAARASWGPVSSSQTVPALPASAGIPSERGRAALAALSRPSASPSLGVRLGE